MEGESPTLSKLINLFSPLKSSENYLMISGGIKLIYFSSLHPLSAYATKWSNTLKQFVDVCLTNPDFSDDRFRKNVPIYGKWSYREISWLIWRANQSAGFYMIMKTLVLHCLTHFRSSCREVSCKKVVLKFTGKHIYLSLFLNEYGCAYFCTEF